MATFIKTDGSSTEVKPQNHKNFSLRELQEFVGGFIELLYLPSGWIIVLDEDGKYKNKPRNPRARSIAVSAGIALNDFVVGNVLVCSRKEMGEE